ncbi:MAG: nitrous oxide reductase family maturation protein NosD, partial [Candidatus Hermodarchaeota archaeon]
SAVSGKIHIIDNSVWLDFKNVGKCTGSGTYSDPYVIEDLIIDGGDSGICILIENSDVFFKIENCTFYKSGEFWGDAGIRLLGVSNGALINNNASYNRRGIWLEDSNNNTISGNTVNNNGDEGISLYFNNNYNTISGNTANNNRGAGILLEYDNNNNTISGNTANNNTIGIGLLFSNNNNISGNTANFNSGAGITVSSCNNSTVSENLIIGAGISLEFSNNSTVSGNIMIKCGLRVYGSLATLISCDIDTTNLVNGKPLYYYTHEVYLGPSDFMNTGQFILVNCNDSVISNLNISIASGGISLYYCNNNTISGNTINNNDIGIRLYNCNNNTISGNTANNNGGGISSQGNNNIISGNIANNNTFNGIHLETSDDNIISGNTVNSNGRYGIAFNDFFCGDCRTICHYNTISENTANNNLVGISLTENEKSTVSRNSANNNKYGIRLSGSYYNNVSGNTANNNLIGIFLEYSINNTVSGNRLIGNRLCILEEYCEGNVIQDNVCTLLPSLNYFPIILIISITIIGVAVFIIYQNREKFRKPQEDLEFL